MHEARSGSLRTLVMLGLLLLAAAAPPSTQPATLPYDEFQQAADLLHLSGEFRDRYEAQVARRHAAFDQWLHSETGRNVTDLREKLDTARRAHDTGHMKVLQAQIAPLSREEVEFRSKIRAEVWALLSLDQQRLWAAHVLEGRTMPAFHGADLTPEQLGSARAIFRRMANEFLQEGMILQDPYLKTMIPLRKSAIEEIARGVLTDEQRVAIRPATKPTTFPATGPATTRSISNG